MHWVSVEIEQKGRVSYNKRVKGAVYIFVAECFLSNVVEENGKKTIVPAVSGGNCIHVQAGF